MDVFAIVELIILAVLTLAFLVWFSIKAVKNKWLSALTETIDKAIGEAEKKWSEGHGEEKKKYVLDCVEKKCEELNIQYHILCKLISKLIDTIIKNHNIVIGKK